MAVDRITLPNEQPALRLVPMPADLNQNGDVFGGWVMAQVDVAGAIPAMRRARGRVATVSVHSFLFNSRYRSAISSAFMPRLCASGRPRLRSMSRFMPSAITLI